MVTVLGSQGTLCPLLCAPLIPSPLTFLLFAVHITINRQNSTDMVR
jgi:hypothetical protein